MHADFANTGYVDGLVAGGKVKDAAIFSLQESFIWAASEGFSDTVTPLLILDLCKLTRDVGRLAHRDRAGGDP